MYYVYVLKSKTTNKVYIGQTENLEKRVARHNGELPTKHSSFTHKQGSAWEVVYTEEFETRSEVIKRERELKSGKGREFIKNRIQ